ncbi:DUF2752 domain-containing protein [Cyanobium sp. Alchichica 3B3-8F6]|uniref:DUF2752 domain-containing protein n=1 Tax=Synechococcales TaxID=1890424 RepID=UPI000B98674F|nr:MULTISPECIES: DUF2752 domain-containing protein [Synechococcales]MCP9882564.1 DUF2752 domain-containing protein [Cyanobium sp. Alchichica 3B3-8F6]MCP9941248.1 DUF2752 domain-containing protein [Cyanobium sp. ATX 6E8]
MRRPTLVRAAGIAAATTVLALATRAGDGRALPLGLWRCPVRQLTGIPCPTCYLTRSVLATLQGDLAQALHWHAFGPLLVALTVGLGVWVAFGGRLSRRPLLQGAVVLAALAVGYWLLRLWGWSHGQPLPP